MKTKFLKALIPKNKQRCGVALLLFACLLSFAITPGSAQLRNQKRITALQFGYAAEGSRVTIVSDSALGDYEAFRRGDRFYVKIPLAEFKSMPPHCCASGFEDVQVQRVGDSLIVSFRLQPGATARVDQRSNRLDVIFSSPDRTFRNNRVATGTNVSRNSQDRGFEAAGPIPPGSATFRQRLLAEGTRANGSQLPQNPRLQSNRQIESNKGPNKQSITGNNQPGGNNQSGAGTNQSTTGKADVALPSPFPSASPILSPSNSSNYPALTTATPAASVSSPAVNSSGSPVSLNWKARGKAALQWVSENRLASLLGALILLSLILYLAIALRRRRRKLITAKRVDASKVQPKVQPKPSSDAVFDEFLNADPVTSPASSNMPKESVKNPSNTSAVVAATPQNQSRVLTKPSVIPPSAGLGQSSKEEEREVFEL